MPGAIGTVFTSLAPAIFVARLRRLGIDPAPVLTRLGLQLEPDANRPLTLPARTFHALGDWAAAASGDPCFGLHTAEALPRGAYGIVEFAARSAPNLRGALGALGRFSRLVNDRTDFTLSVTGGVASWDEALPGEALAVGRQGNEYTVAYVLRVAREATGVALRPRQVWFAHPAPEDPGPLRRFFEAPLVFSAGSNGFSLAAEALDTPLVSADPALAGALRQHLDGAVGEGLHDGLDQVRARLRAVLPLGGALLEHTAAGLKMSARTLQRRIRAEGCTWQELVDGERQRLATAYLQAPGMPLGEIAFRLGYSDLAVFTRAFKRWTGVTPKQFQRQSVS